MSSGKEVPFTKQIIRAFIELPDFVNEHFKECWGCRSDYYGAIEHAADEAGIDLELGGDESLEETGENP